MDICLAQAYLHIIEYRTEEGPTPINLAQGCQPLRVNLIIIRRG